jgi:uncharacterized protein YndB with AHSA1/START domain
MTELPEFKFDRLFDAPREMVWTTWTDPELLAHWYGPGVTTIIHKFDLEPDGMWLNEMKWGDKSDFSKMIFQEVLPPKKLVWQHCSADAQWNIAPSQMMPDWPRKLLTTVIFEDLGEQTNVQLSQIPMDATDKETACFAEFMNNMQNGWGSGYKLIDELLEKLVSDRAQ